MIRKLRRKFILINMSLVTLVLLIVFAVICYSSYQQTISESRRALFQLLDHSAFSGEVYRPPRLELDAGGKREPIGAFGMLPSFCASLDEADAILSTFSQTLEVSDEMVQTAVTAALESPERSGTLPALGLRFQIQQTESGKKIAFVDMEAEHSTMAHLLLVSLLVGLGGLTAFFFISLLLSKIALRPVEYAWQQQHQFIADASHELKTPLTVILANLGILQAHPEDRIRAQQKWLDNTKEEAERMKQLVEDMLFLARSDHTSLQAVPILFNLSDFIWSAVLPFEAIAFEQGTVLDSDIEDNLLYLGNEAELKQLSMILLDNALKYCGSPGHICVRLKKKPDGIAFSVQNNGAPIPPEQQAHIFERFYRGDPSRARAQGGYGLGLAIACQIAAHHHGHLSVSSTQQTGTVFSLWLPQK